MESSPLTQQTRPETFQPKIVKLYETLLFNSDYAHPTEGFWREFFLLQPDRVYLSKMIASISSHDILHLQTLTAFLASALSKRYTNPSSDIIAVLVGLDEVDYICSEFVTVLDSLIRNGSSCKHSNTNIPHLKHLVNYGAVDVRLKAIDTAMAMVGGAYKTGVMSYFIHRDLFPSLMKALLTDFKFIHDSDTHTQVLRPFLLLGLLANYNKFDFQNPYQLRLNDFVNETAIRKVVRGAGVACASLRNSYISVQDDLPEGWNWNTTLSFFSFGFLAPGRRHQSQPLTVEEMKERFKALPSPEAAVLLAIYDFVNANKLFGHTLVTTSAEKRSEEAPFASFLSLTSYLLQHAYRSARVALYAEANLFSLRNLVEDPVICKQICSDENNARVRLCRQRAPHLPLVNGERVLATVIFDILVDTINHNLRRSLDTYLYSHTIIVLFRLLTYASSNKVRFSYHWSELWRALLTLTRFLTTYSMDLMHSPHIQTVTADLIDLITFCISAGDTFLPDPSSYDDLFYKVVEADSVLKRFRDVYKHLSVTSSHSTNSTLSINALISVSTHFHSLLFVADSADASRPGSKSGESTTASSPPPARKKRLSPREVHQIIKEGYSTLSIRANDDLINWEKWRDADWKPQLKRITRTAVEDVTTIISQPEQPNILMETKHTSGG
ncbi:uncharacterized protein ARB_02262 [Trichophyton benhamiae CBS 112371]|uniref:Armadillo-like helical domain-containing protein n=1 Tax=Arthroderma benhamiae (strain ATCC MYA-4681 / CBS 112371) TaxID=663331 RepID=D4B1D3_ARTBC|nr:uncharacterized protein ARB_02262 [Trichophyton benhamiae CBS 112371]EFE30772.1 hypothetical protein ARB_02262 [Trichophyton benhamiae CBS 112371]